jgi:energy-coupling factor transporter transmembrane protein EcfT
MSKIGKLIGLITFLIPIILLITKLVIGDIDDFEIITIAILFLLNIVIILLLIISSIFKGESAKKFKIIGILFINVPLVIIFFYLSDFPIFNTEKGYFYNYNKGEVIRPALSDDYERGEFINGWQISEIKIAGN